MRYFEAAVTSGTVAVSLTLQVMGLGIAVQWAMLPTQAKQVADGLKQMALNCESGIVLPGPKIVPPGKGN